MRAYTINIRPSRSHPYVILYQNLRKYQDNSSVLSKSVALHPDILGERATMMNKIQLKHNYIN